MTSSPQPLNVTATFLTFLFCNNRKQNKPSLREPAAGQSPFTCKQNPGLACLWLWIWQSTQDDLRKGWRGHWQGAGVFSSSGLSLAMLIVRALPYKDNHCTVKTKQPQQKLSGKCCSSSLCIQSLFSPKPLSGVITNKKSQVKGKR